MRARAFQEWAQAEPSLEISAQLHRPLEKSHELYAFGVWLYNWIQRTAPFLHHAYFNFLEVVPIVRTGKPLGAAKYRKVLEELQPDVLLSVHDSLNHGFFEYAREVLGHDRVKCVTYCGELSGGYGFSRHWVNPSADLFIGAVPETCEAAVRLGMAPERTQVGGFLLRRFFYDPPEDDGRARGIHPREVAARPGRIHSSAERLEPRRAQSRPVSRSDAAARRRCAGGVAVRQIADCRARSFRVGQGQPVGARPPVAAQHERRPVDAFGVGDRRAPGHGHDQRGDRERVPVAVEQSRRHHAAGTYYGEVLSRPRRGATRAQPRRIGGNRHRVAEAARIAGGDSSGDETRLSAVSPERYRADDCRARRQSR